MVSQQVSIIIPCYNCEKLINKTIQSIYKQSYVNWECIMVDDGSTDATKENLLVWEKRDERFKYVYQDNLGLSGARNTGLEKANGEFVYFIDADDLLDDNTIESLLSYTSIDIDIVFGRCAETSGQNKDIIGLMPHELEINKVFNNVEGSLIKMVLENDLVCVAWNRLYRNAFLKQNKLRFLDGVLHEDELWFFETLFYAKAIILGDKVTYFYNKGNETSITSSYGIKNINAYLRLTTFIYNEYYLSKKGERYLDIIASYLIRLKKEIVSSLFEKITYSDRNLAIDNIQKAFMILKVERTKRVLNKRIEKSFYLFQTLSIYSINVIVWCYSNERHRSIWNKIKFKFYKKTALLINAITRKTQKFY